MNSMSSNGPRPRVLVVDDEENISFLVESALQLDGIETAKANDGYQALSLLKTFSPHAIVLDVMMPGIDGFEVLRKVKKAHPEVQVIVLTGHGSEQDQEVCMQLGAYEYHKKPVDIDRLVKSIKGAYRQKMEDMMVAATFAEANDSDDAVKALEEDK